MANDFYDVENILLIVNHGKISYTQGGTQQQVAAGEILFIPGGKATTLTYGTAALINLDKERFALNQSAFLQSL